MEEEERDAQRTKRLLELRNPDTTKAYDVRHLSRGLQEIKAAAMDHGSIKSPKRNTRSGLPSTERGSR